MENTESRNSITKNNTHPKPFGITESQFRQSCTYYMDRRMARGGDQRKGAGREPESSNMADLNKYSLTKGLKFDPK